MVLVPLSAFGKVYSEDHAQVYGLSIEGAITCHLIILVTIRSNKVYGLSTDGMTSYTY